MADFTCWTCGRPTTYEGEGYWRCDHCKESFYEGYDEDYTFGYSEDELKAAL